MKNKTGIYFNLVTVAAATVLLVLWPYDALVHASMESLVGAGTLMLIAYASEALAFYLGSGVILGSSIAYLPFLACLVLFPPAVAVPAIAIAVAGSSIYPNRRPRRTAVFNVSQAILAASVSGALFDFLFPIGTIHTAPAILPAFAVLTIVFLLTNMALVAGAISLLKGKRFNLVLAEVIGLKGGNLVHGLLSSPIALLIVLLYDNAKTLGIVLFLLPLLLVRYSFANNVALQKDNNDIIKVLIKAIETRDPYTSGHSLRVATLAVAIAEDLGLSRQKIDDVEVAALLHDVGKIDPSFSAVIRKPYDLSAEERALIQTHAAIGADLLLNLKSVKPPIVAAVRHHHERMDGGGYPDGLVGDAIPLPARIIMLCDSIDAMLSDRPYRKALPLDRVRQELVRCAGDQFDAEIVKVVLQKDTLTKACQLIDTVSGFEDEYLIRARA
jgi:putative nucleotidyltransferase with HDIG domain